jgi:hypothetical protein
MPDRDKSFPRFTETGSGCPLALTAPENIHLLPALGDRRLAPRLPFPEHHFFEFGAQTRKCLSLPTTSAPMG